MGNAVGLIHAYLGESLVTLSVIGLVLALIAKDPKGKLFTGAVVAGRVIAVLLSVQWLFGIVNYFSLPGDVRPGLAHPLLMTVVVAGFHMLMGRARKAGGAARFTLAGIFAATALLIVFGIQVVR